MALCIVQDTINPLHSRAAFTGYNLRKDDAEKVSLLSSHWIALGVKGSLESAEAGGLGRLDKGAGD